MYVLCLYVIVSICMCGCMYVYACMSVCYACNYVSMYVCVHVKYKSAAYPSIRLSVCPPGCMFACPPICLSVWLMYVCMCLVYVCLCHVMSCHIILSCNVWTCVIATLFPEVRRLNLKCFFWNIIQKDVLPNYPSSP